MTPTPSARPSESAPAPALARAWDQAAGSNGPIERLLEQQRGLTDVLLGQGSPEGVLAGLCGLFESALPPWRCSLAVFDAGGEPHETSSHGFSPSLASLLRQGGAACATPGRAAAASGERIIVADLAGDARWPDHAREALADGHRACWAEPLGRCGDGLSAVLSLYHRKAEPPNAAAESLVRALSPFIRVAIDASLRAEAWRHADEQLRSLSTSIPGVVYQRRVKPDGDIRYTYISEGARDLFGLAPKDILSDPEALFSRHSADYKAKFRERLLAASQSLTMWDVEATIVTPEGRKTYTHAIARPQPQPDGSVLWTGLILDETRTRQAIIESLAQGILLYDGDDRLVLRNASFVELYPGLRDIAVPGAAYKDLVCAEIAQVAGLGPDLERSLLARLERHQEPHNIFEQQLDDDRWLLVNEHRTADGGTVVLYTDISELKRREKQIQHLAYYDSLTGVPNRVLFQQRIEDAFAKARVSDAQVTVMCLDVDNFKAVNDTLGHSAGDALLKSIGERLRECLRDSDTVGRLGGDEFGIIIPNLPRPDFATTLAWRILGDLSQPIDHNGHQVRCTVSIGIATCPTDGRDGDTLLKNADLALYRAKAEGRGAFRFFAAEMDARAQARRTLEMDLRNAIARDELQVHYQPQVDIKTDEIIGFEALVRWLHPERGMIPPCDFIPIAEETGAIVALGTWVMRRACLDALAWPKTVKIAVNVSPAQFRNNDLLDTVTAVLAETGLEPHRLELEITESLLLRDIKANLLTLQNLKALGVRISMDDFGTGYSSLSNLRSFPFDKIKIDRSFVAELEQSPDSVAIVCAVLGLGRSLGISTCAEGVETMEQLQRLKAEGCSEVQGYIYSKPKPIAEIASMLKANAER